MNRHDCLAPDHHHIDSSLFVACVCRTFGRHSAATGRYSAVFGRHGVALGRLSAAVVLPKLRKLESMIQHAFSMHSGNSKDRFESALEPLED